MFHKTAGVRKCGEASMANVFRPWRGNRPRRAAAERGRRHGRQHRPKTAGRLSTARCATRRLQYGDCVVRV